jgi:hypothetical protein
MKKQIIIALFLGLILGLGLNSVVYASGGHKGEQIEENNSQVEHENTAEHSQPEEHHQSAHEETDAHGGHEETEAHGGEHGDGGGHGEHHIWWTFSGHEILLSVFSCIYFALFIIIIARFFGTDLEGHH